MCDLLKLNVPMEINWKIRGIDLLEHVKKSSK